MAEWGGAQWLIVFGVIVRGIIGAAVWGGVVVLPRRNETPRQRFLSRRLTDAILIGILVWGGFFS